jgi:hypothetical protein
MLPVAAFALSIALVPGASPAGTIAPPVSAGDDCSADTFAIDGSSVLVQLCARAGKGSDAKTLVTEILSVKGQPALVRTVALDALPGADASRAIDDAPLEKLGLTRTLHLTIAVKNGSVRLEHALLVPGAVALK